MLIKPLFRYLLPILFFSHAIIAGQAIADIGGDDPPTRLERARDAIDNERYDRAVKHLKKHLKQNPDDADGLNYMGYSLRKLGEFEDSENYYQKALEIEPNHLGANEYLGELYLQTGRLEQAQERLAILQSACGDCEEYEELKEAIDEYAQ